MQKISALSDKEKSGEIPLDGTYRVWVDLHVEASNNTTTKAFQEKLASLGDVENFSIEKYSTEYDLEVGDAVELTTPLEFEKAVFIDTQGNLIVSDRPFAEVESVGNFQISLSVGMIAEVNKKASNDQIEILFTGYEVEIPQLQKVAYIGILNLPCTSVSKYNA